MRKRSACLWCNNTPKTFLHKKNIMTQLTTTEYFCSLSNKQRKEMLHNLHEIRRLIINEKSSIKIDLNTLIEFLESDHEKKQKI